MPAHEERQADLLDAYWMRLRDDPRPPRQRTWSQRLLRRL